MVILFLSVRWSSWTAIRYDLDGDGTPVEIILRNNELTVMLLDWRQEPITIVRSVVGGIELVHDSLDFEDAGSYAGSYTE